MGLSRRYFADGYMLTVVGDNSGDGQGIASFARAPVVCLLSKAGLSSASTCQNLCMSHSSYSGLAT